MAEAESTEPATGSEENDGSCSGDTEPKPKKVKLSFDSDNLEERLNEILCCAVCLDLPKDAIYQCRNGHLMCSECFNHLLADAQLRLGAAICPSCRTLISRDLCVRNLVVEKAASELPARCANCHAKYARCLHQVHQEQFCLERPSVCLYNRIGCPWTGPYKKKIEHEKRCAQPEKQGSEIKGSIPAEFLQNRSEDLYQLLDLLTAERVSYNDLQLLGPYHTDDYYIRYETFRFCTFGLEWEVRARVNENDADPTQSCERTLSYQLLLKESVDRDIFLRYMLVKGPFGEMKIKPKLEKFRFGDTSRESHYAQLALQDSSECFRLLSGTIRFRLMMFWDDKSSDVFGY
ncbi:zinc finger TRAF-type-containing protein 1 homolog [Uloborus diversus]|uniref:zinc finger TRAF-type-containing protein 1 homolog n=1 Tax=Uloborus diversus TaxID=327109 RepID=UPI0024094E53|nr:zinc finger TRAF-type-containing protein 1 homolog [Uloborus diversus]